MFLAQLNTLWNIGSPTVIIIPWIIQNVSTQHGRVILNRLPPLGSNVCVSSCRENSRYFIQSIRFAVITKVNFATMWISFDMFYSSRFKEKGPISSLRWEPFSGVFSRREMFFPGMKCFFPVEISILVDPKQISVVSKSEKQKKKKKKKKRILCHPPVMPLGPFDLVTYATSPFSLSLSLSLFLVGALRTIF